ncbi:MAG: glycosyltransferase family 4 protein [Candidatus Levybacteria bacterium]|nr:glycosyltransferase family 4 protein [Candidatus Levybacteria bacterium]
MKKHKSQLKVFIDRNPLKGGHAVRGVGAYTRNLLAALKKQKEIELVEKTENCDVVHYPYFDLFFLTLPLIKPKPTVVTVHDVIPLIYPEHYKAGLRGLLKFQIQKYSLTAASAIITDSETSKKDIVRFLDVPQEKVHVAHLAAGNEFRKMEDGGWRVEIRKKYGLPERFILYVGDVNYNKNIPGLIQAFNHLTIQPSNNSTNLKLVLVGDVFKNETLPEIKEIFQLIKRLNLEDKIMAPGFVPTEELVYLYNLATVYCQPSFYEGFGLPVLEAMACGCPVVVAKTQSLVEIAGGAAIFVDPKDTKDIADGISKVINYRETRDMLSKSGIERAKEFSWGKTAKKTIEVYHKVLRSKLSYINT